MKSPQAQFQGNVVGDVAYNTSEYLVYVSPGTKILKMLHPEQNPIIIDFSKYGVEINLDEAEYWFCKAINNGNESSPGALERVQKKLYRQKVILNIYRFSV